MEKKDIQNCVVEVVVEFLIDIKNCPDCKVRGISKRGYFVYGLCKKHKGKFKEIFEGW